MISHSLSLCLFWRALFLGVVVRIPTTFNVVYSGNYNGITCTSFSSLQHMSPEELAEMPSCNLAESVHNKWLQQSGKRGNDLFVAAVDDMVRAFTQISAYYQFLNGEKAGTGPGKEELRLRSAQRTAQRTGNPKPLVDAMKNMPGANAYCTRDPHLEGEEVFVSLKRKPDLPPGSEFDSHRPDKISISRQ